MRLRRFGGGHAAHSGEARGLRAKATQKKFEVRHFARLAEVVIHTRLDARVAEASHGVRSHGDNRDASNLEEVVVRKSRGGQFRKRARWLVAISDSARFAVHLLG